MYKGEDEANVSTTPLLKVKLFIVLEIINSNIVKVYTYNESLIAIKPKTKERII